MSKKNPVRHLEDEHGCAPGALALGFLMMAILMVAIFVATR